MTSSLFFLGLVVAQAGASTGVELLPEPSPWRWNLVLNTTARWQQDDGDIAPEGNPRFDPTGENFGDWLSTFGGSIGYNEFVANVRFDTALYTNRPIAGGGATSLINRRLTDRYKNTFRLEFLSATYSGRDGSITLGDFYATLGRGLVLAVRKVDDVGTDNKIRGAEARVKVGGFRFHIFGGFLNLKNFEPGTGFAYQETNDLLGGARIEYGFGKYLRLGAHAAYIKPKDLIGPEGLIQQESRTVGYAATIELPRPVKWASLYMEFARRERDTKIFGIDGAQDGYGFYANANLFFGPVTILAEGKVYDNLLPINPGDLSDAPDPSLKLQGDRSIINRIAEPATAERPGAIILRNIKVAGGRVRADYRVTPKLVPYVSVGAYRDTDSPGDPANIGVVFGGSRVKWASGHVLAEIGYRAEVTESDNELLTRDIHWLFDLTQKLFSVYSSELFSNGRHASERGNDPWFEGRLALSFKSADGWSATGAYEFYTKSDNTKKHYFSIGGQWEFMEGGIVRALYGGERAGLKCSGGVCRQFPAFEGGRLELNIRY